MNKVIANSSLAHTVGNVTSLMTEFIKQRFPDNYFRHTHINSRMAYREQKREENSNYEFIVKNKPILIIRPKLDLENTDIFLYNSFYTSNFFDQSFVGSSFNFLPFYRDPEAKCRISYLMNRIRVIFDVTIMLDTEFEQINQYAYLLNLFIPNRVYRMDTALETYIPGNLIELVSAYSGIPIFDNDSGTVKPFLDYMMHHCNNYVTFKERTSSSTKDFFMFRPTSIEYVFTDFSKDEVSKKSWSSYSCNINFTVTTEFNTVGIYEFLTLQTDNRKIEIHTDVLDNRGTHLEGINIFPFFTVPNLFENVKMDNGFQMFYTQAFETDEQIYMEPDTLDLYGIFDRTNLKDIVKWHQQNGIPNDVFIKILVAENNKMLKEGEDFTIDLAKPSITILKSNPDKTYRLSIYLNNLYVNQLMENFNSISNTYEQQVGKVTDKTINIKRDNEIGVK